MIARTVPGRGSARLALFVAWATIVLGALHVLATPAYVPGLGEPAMWFASGGAAFVLVGALNVLRVRHPGVASGLRSVCLAANITTSAFTATLAVVMGATLTHEPQVLLAVALAVGATALTVAE